jgi:hypothetical protein
MGESALYKVRESVHRRGGLGIELAVRPVIVAISAGPIGVRFGGVRTKWDTGGCFINVFEYPGGDTRQQSSP